MTSGDLLNETMPERRDGMDSPLVLKQVDLSAYPEEPAFRQRRLQLEDELKQLNSIWDQFISGKQSVAAISNNRASDSLSQVIEIR